MYKHSNKLIRTALFSVLFTLSCAANAECTRHFYNQSSSEWTVIFGGENPNKLSIPANSTIPIQYRVGGIPWTNAAYLTVQGPNYQRSFSIENRIDCVYLDHDGNTGRAVLNQPANGDITFIN